MGDTMKGEERGFLTTESGELSGMFFWGRALKMVKNLAISNGTIPNEVGRKLL
jgi:hypothetical protein